jgi:hypothetical protein
MARLRAIGKGRRLYTPFNGLSHSALCSARCSWSSVKFGKSPYTKLVRMFTWIAPSNGHRTRVNCLKGSSTLYTFSRAQPTLSRFWWTMYVSTLTVRLLWLCGVQRLGAAY